MMKSINIVIVFAALVLVVTACNNTTRTNNGRFNLLEPQETTVATIDTISIIEFAITDSEFVLTVDRHLDGDIYAVETVGPTSVVHFKGNATYTDDTIFIKRNFDSEKEYPEILEKPIAIKIYHRKE